MAEPARETTPEAAPGATPEAMPALERLAELTEALESHPDPAVRAQVTALLGGIDLVHREALARLVEGIRAMAGDSFLNRLTADPAVRLLLMSYDLIAVDRRTLAEDALDAVRPHLRAHGVGVEVVGVLGGVVSVRLHGAPPGHPRRDGARRDVEEALRLGLLGFQELALVDGPTAGAAPAFVPRESLRRARRPAYQAVLRADELAAGGTRGVVVEGAGVLLARVGDEVFAVRNACGASPLPLDYSALEGAELRCSWHGCRYDVRTGRRVDLAEPELADRLDVLPVRVRDGVVEIAVGTTTAA